MLLNIRRLQDPLSPRGLHLSTCSVLCCMCCFFWTLTAFIYTYFMREAFVRAARRYILATPGMVFIDVFSFRIHHTWWGVLPLCVCFKSVWRAASKFQDNQPSNYGNLTRLGWHITLMNGTCLIKQHRAAELLSLFRLLEDCWWNLRV